MFFGVAIPENKLDPTDGSPQKMINVPKYDFFSTWVTRYANRRNFLQDRFNLFREETEGWSRLLIILMQADFDLNQVCKIVHEF